MTLGSVSFYLIKRLVLTSNHQSENDFIAYKIKLVPG